MPRLIWRVNTFLAQETKMVPIQCRMARMALGMGIRDLALLAKVAPATVTRFEGGEELKPRTVEALQKALEDAGIILIDANGHGPGVRLRDHVIEKYKRKP